MVCFFSACSRPISGDKIITKPMGDGLTMKFEKTKTIYDNFVVIADPSRSSHSFGPMIKAQLPCMTDKQYATLEKEYTSKNKCPASFYNKNVKSLMILSDNPNLDAIFKTIKDKDKITIEGYQLKLEGMYTPDNQKMNMSNGFRDKINFVMADKITINGQMHL